MGQPQVRSGFFGPQIHGYDGLGALRGSRHPGQFTSLSRSRRKNRP